MGTTIYLYLSLLLSGISLSSADSYAVKIVTEHFVNLVDSRFLSFTIDPSYLFSTSEKFSSQECVCMASSLTPAYLRIAGPSTSHMSFQNTTISINDINLDHQDDLEITALDSDVPKKVPMEVKSTKLAVTHREWRKFIHWAKSIGFDLVFALNNEERTASSMWDPNTALNILTVAEKARVGDMFWELGYECTNQSIEEYLNDLETLRVIIETFPPGRTGEWKVVGGDVSKCLQADSKSDFKDYITLSNDMMDALLLNGNSSSQELDRMSELDRMRLLRFLSHSKTPLWLTETNERNYNQLERAADWLSSLGYSAKNGFSVHYRELEEEEMYEPTLSFYMALLFKNLVGERVLNVEMDPEQAILFAHCTSLRHKPVPGAVTLFGVNMDDKPARFSLRMSKREEGGDIMQFILGHDHSGNIVVNGRAMYYEGDIRPVVKHVRPYKTLLINLPPKSFGFWVLANTNIEACRDVEETKKDLSEIENYAEQKRDKRSVDDDFDDYMQIANLTYDFVDTDENTTGNQALESRVFDMNKDLAKISRGFLKRKERVKRQNVVDEFKKMRQKLRSRIDRHKLDLNLDPRGLVGNILQKAKQGVGVLKSNGLNGVKHILGRNKVSKRHSKISKGQNKKPTMKYLESHRLGKAPKKHTNFNKISRLNTLKKQSPKRNLATRLPDRINRKSLKVAEPPKKIVVKEDKITKKGSIENIISQEESKILEPKSRQRRHVDEETEEITHENEIEFDEKNKAKFWRIFKKLHEDLKDFSEEDLAGDDEESEDGIVLKTELSDDTATIKVTDPGRGLLKSSMKNMVNVIKDLNKNLNRFWSALSLLE